MKHHCFSLYNSALVSDFIYMLSCGFFPSSLAFWQMVVVLPPVQYIPGSTLQKRLRKTNHTNEKTWLVWNGEIRSIFKVKRSNFEKIILYFFFAPSHMHKWIMYEKLSYSINILWAAWRWTTLMRAYGSLWTFYTVLWLIPHQLIRSIWYPTVGEDPALCFSNSHTVYPPLNTSQTPALH